jgi:hypothetical protein
MTNFKLGLLIPMMYLNVKFKFKIYNCWGDNEQKLKLSHFFQSYRGITLSEIIKPRPISNLTSVFLWHIHILNLNWICTTVGLLIPMTSLYVKFELKMYNCWEDNEPNWKLLFFSKLIRHNSAKIHWTITKFELNGYYRWGDNERKQNKRAIMALDRSPDPSTASKQCLRQASWPSLMTIESKMWPLVC